MPERLALWALSVSPSWHCDPHWSSSICAAGQNPRTKGLSLCDLVQLKSLFVPTSNLLLDIITSECVLRFLAKWSAINTESKHEEDQLGRRWWSKCIWDSIPPEAVVYIWGRSSLHWGKSQPGLWMRWRKCPKQARLFHLVRFWTHHTWHGDTVFML